MKRIKLVLAVGAVMVAMLALNAGSAMADDDLAFWGWGDYGEIESVEIESDGELDIEFEGGGDIETYDYDLLDYHYDYDDYDDDDDDDDEEDFEHFVDLD
jgi:hypothetical protein